MKNKLLLCIVFLIVTGCARHVVVNPEDVGRYGSSDWEIKSQPNQ